MCTLSLSFFCRELSNLHLTHYQSEELAHWWLHVMIVKVGLYVCVYACVHDPLRVGFLLPIPRALSQLSVPSLSHSSTVRDIPSHPVPPPTVPSRFVSYRPVPSHPVLSRPVLSRPVSSHAVCPVPSPTFPSRPVPSRLVPSEPIYAVIP